VQFLLFPSLAGGNEAESAGSLGLRWAPISRHPARDSNSSRHILRHAPPLCSHLLNPVPQRYAFIWL